MLSLADEQRAKSWRVPDSLPAWYLACPAAGLKTGQVRAVQVAQRELALYRGRHDGLARALGRHCAHMGGNLANGDVVADELRCPLHHWRFAGNGECVGAPAGFGEVRACVPSYPVAERLGSLLVFNGRTASFAPPPHIPEFRWSAGPPVVVGAPWYSLIANPFDVMHIQTIHHRELLEEPRLQRLDQHRMTMKCVWRVSGTGLSDRIMRWLSRDRITVEFTCFGGPLLLIRSDLGRAQSSLFVGLQPLGESCGVQLVFGSQGGRLAAFLCRWLYTEFLRRDLAVLEGARFRPYTGRSCDGPLGVFASFLEELGAQ
jgi:aminopyrrolnitrin oxygenase